MKNEASILIPINDAKEIIEDAIKYYRDGLYSLEEAMEEIDRAETKIEVATRAFHETKMNELREESAYDEWYENTHCQ